MRTVCGVVYGTPCSEKVLPLLQPPRRPVPTRHKVPRDREVEAMTVPLLLPTATMEVESGAGKPAGASSAQVNQPQHTKATRPEAQ